MPGPSCICDLHHSSQQLRILNPLSEGRDRTCILMDACQFRFCWATRGTQTVDFLERQQRKCKHQDPGHQKCNKILMWKLDTNRVLCVYRKMCMYTQKGAIWILEWASQNLDRYIFFYLIWTLSVLGAKTWGKVWWVLSCLDAKMNQGSLWCECQKLSPWSVTVGFTML